MTKKKLNMEATSLEESDLKGMEVCNFGGTEIALPLELIEQVSSTTPLNCKPIFL